MAVVEAQAAGLPCVLSATITRDVDVSPLVRYLPLGDPDRWADAMLERRPRLDTAKNIVKAGFDIRTSAKRLSALYTELAGA
jgi:glycosyltransferase involved in cell wall biosynthesis